MKDVSAISVSFSLFVSLFALAHALDKCTTPDGEPGQCVRVKACHSLVEIINKKQLTDDDRDFLKQSQCKYGREPWVCCPTNLLPAFGESLCGTTNSDILVNRIFGGESTSIGEFPWMAVLIYRKPNDKISFGCGAALISKKFVLTAAHCVFQELLPRTWTLSHIRLGELDRRSDPDCQETEGGRVCADVVLEIGISRIIPHEEYDYTSASKLHDIALLALEYPVVYTNYIRPLCLNKKAENTGAATLIGFGRTETRNSSQRLLQTEIDVEAQAVCDRKYRVHGRSVGDSQLCAYRYQSDSCNGDSGSPLMSKSSSQQPWYIIGIVSYGPANCGKSDLPGIYTKVNNYIDWIKAKIKL